MSIHARIRERRLALGMTSHQALAEKIPVSWQTVQLWEKEDDEGGTAPNRNRIGRVAEVLETTPEYLLYGDEDKKTAASMKVAAKLSPVINKRQATMIAELFALFMNTDERGRDEIMDIARGVGGGIKSAGDKL